MSSTSTSGGSLGEQPHRLGARCGRAHAQALALERLAHGAAQLVVVLEETGGVGEAHPRPMMGAER